MIFSPFLYNVFSVDRTTTGEDTMLVMWTRINQEMMRASNTEW